MSGLCGWIEGEGRTSTPDSVLERMADGLGDARTGLSRSVSGPQHALAVRSSPECAAWCVDDELAVAVEGYPIWNEPALAAEAARLGHAAALTTAYREFGVGLFDHLRGAFSLAIVAAPAGRAVVAIDRWGIQTLSYGRSRGGGLVFGSTADAVRGHPDVGATIRPQAIYTYLLFVDRVPAPDTIYAEQTKLVPGQYVIFDRGTVETKSCWRMPYREVGRRDVDDLNAELMDRLRTAVARNVADEELSTVGTFLSGGLDSSTVAGLLAEISPPGEAKTFSIGFDVDGFDETAYAKRAADHFRTDHTVYYITATDVRDVVESVATAYDEPFANSSVVPAYVCALRAREAGVEVMLAGDGGGELFGGNARYVKDAVFDHYARIPRFFRRGVIEPIVGLLPASDTVSLFRRARNYVRIASMSVPQRMMRDSLFEIFDPEHVFSDSVRPGLDSADLRSFAQEIFDSSGSPSKIHGMFQFDLRVTLADSDLRKVGRMCELAGVRVRYPFLDNDLAEYSATIAPDLLMKGGQLRYFYKEAVRHFLPEEILTKEKHGFGILDLEYVSSHAGLRDLFCDAINGLRNRPWFEPVFLDRVVDSAHRGDIRRYGSAVWDLAILEMWLRSRQPFAT